jgi:hypothetical protein
MRARFSSTSARLCALLFPVILSPVILSTVAFAQQSAIPQSPAQRQTSPAAPRPLIAQPIDESQLTVLKGNTHPLARPEFDLGTAPATLSMQRMLLVLKRSPEQESALKQLLDDQQDKSSPSYHKWLTPEDFGKQFGPADADIQTITAWLQAHGFQVGSTKGRTVLEFSGSASQVQEAFHTTIRKYIVNGEQHWANSTDPQIPTALTAAIAGIDSLHTFRKKAMNSFVGSYSEKTKQVTSAEPNFTYACGNGFECYAIVPYDFATIYDVLPLWNSGINGSGQTIAIVGRTDFYAKDATDFWQLFGLTVPANKVNIIYNGVYSGITSDEGEADIDVQWSGAVAPQAMIDFVDSASTEATDGVDLSALYIVDNNLAPVMSESYGVCELGLGTAGNQFHYVLWEQAAAQGISVFVSSGDNGSAGCDDPGGPAQFGLNVNGLASTPFNAAVGGTDFNQYNTWTTYWNSTNNPATQESAKGYIPETTWNDSCTNALAITLGFGSTAEQACNNPQMIAAGGVISTAGSGGPSNCVVNNQTVGSCSQGYAKPSWQSGAGVPNDNLRDLPDISLFASDGFMSSFYVICQRDLTGGICDLNNFAGYGGTSVASPAFAGIMSLVNQKIGEPQGVPGFVLYKLASKQPNAFHDVPSGSTIAMPCYKGSPNCTVSNPGDSYGVLSGYSTGSGYDLATGLGSVDASNLVDNWSKVTFTATSSTLQLNSGNPVNVTHGTAIPVNIGVAPTAAAGEASLLVSTGATTTGQAIDVFSLNGGSFSGTTSLLPAGTYNVMAHYAGDGTYGGSYSSPVSVTVDKENSAVVLGGVILSGTSDAITSVPFDAKYFVRADIGNSQGKLCDPAPFGEIACPGGGVIFTDNGNQLLSTFALNSEGYTETWVGAIGGLTGGTHTLGVQYSGDSNYNASAGTVQVTVTRAATNTTPVTAQGAITQSVTLTTGVQDPNTAATTLPTPTGTVTFYSNGAVIPGSPTYSLGSNGIFLYMTATQAATFPSPGTYTLTSGYSGDQNYQPSSSSASQVTLQYPQPTVSATPASQTVSAGAPATIAVLVDTGIKTQAPTGTVSFINSDIGTPGPTTCTQNTDARGNYACQATFTFTPPPPSESSVDFFSVQYSGDTNYPASQSGPYWIYISDFSLNTGTGTVTVAQGQSQQATINVSGLNGFNGTVSNFSCSGLPAETSCSFNPTSVTNSGSTSLTISTTLLGQLRHPASGALRGAGWLPGGAIFLLSACLAGIPARRRKRAALMALLTIAFLMIFTSCGGGGSGGGTATNPVPSITSLSPAQLAAGSQSARVTINGSGFISSSAVAYNGVAHPITFTSSSEISILLTSSDLSGTGTFPVVVTNSAPGGGTSASVNFDVVTGTPTGSFTVTVTATSGTLSHNTSFNLVVQ